MALYLRGGNEPDAFNQSLFGSHSQQYLKAPVGKILESLLQIGMGE